MSYSMKRKLQNFAEFLVVMSVILSIVGAVVVGVTTLVNHSTHVSCLRLHEATGFETKTSGVASPTCYVHVGKVWVPSDKWIGNTPTDAK